MNEQINTLPVNALNAQTPTPLKKSEDPSFYNYNFPDRIASVAIRHMLAYVGFRILLYEEKKKRKNKKYLS